ncbi:MAG TPA: amidohydrolase family protein [Nocardioidaceae bacterium]|nr:amidohydrolase family protein [Nocardioidaceae bacterium]
MAGLEDDHGDDVVDVHAHMVPPAVLAAIEAGECPGLTLTRVDGGDAGATIHTGAGTLGPLRPGMVEIDRRLRWMDERGIAEQWVSPWLDLLSGVSLPPAQARQWARIVNEGLFDLAHRGGGRLRAVPVVHLASGEQAAQDVAALAPRVVAVMVNTHPAEAESLAHPSLEPFWQALSDASLPAILHPPVNGPSCAFTPTILQNVFGRLTDTSAAVLDLMTSGVLDRHPGLRLVVVHGGALLPYQAYRLDGLERAGLLAKTAARATPSSLMRRLYYDTVALDPLSIELLVRRVGSDRVLLGSDAPFAIGHPDPIGAVAAAQLPAEAKRAITSMNARVVAGPATSAPVVP